MRLPPVRVAFALFCAVMLGPALHAAENSPALPVKVAANDAKLRYVGRFDRADAAGPRAQWPGAHLTFRFHGRDANVLLHDSAGGGPNKNGGLNANYVTVAVDAAAPVTLDLGKDRTVVRVADGLAEGEHTVTVFKNTEAFVGTLQFRGVELNEGARLLDAPAAPDRRLLVVGDSISCGYGNTAAKAQDHFCPATEDNYQAYGAVAGRAVKADVHCIAWSGKGMYSNYGGKVDQPMPELFERTLPMAKDSVWDPKAFVPHAVVINLGTNDFSDKNLAQENYIGNYRAFLERLRGLYPDAHFYLAVGSMLSGKNLETSRAWLNELLKERAAKGDTKIHYLEFAVQSGQNGIGADWHPSVKTHQLMADKLVAALKADLSW